MAALNGNTRVIIPTALISVAATLLITVLTLVFTLGGERAVVLEHIKSPAIHENEISKTTRIDARIDLKQKPMERDIAYIKDMVDKIDRRLAKLE